MLNNSFFNITIYYININININLQKFIIFLSSIGFVKTFAPTALTSVTADRYVAANGHYGHAKNLTRLNTAAPIVRRWHQLQLYNGEDSKNFDIIVLHILDIAQCQLNNIIFKQKIRKVYVRVSIKKTSNYCTL